MHGIVYLNYLNRSLSALITNLSKITQDYEAVIISQYGIAAAINRGFRMLGMGYETYTILGNDIEEPEDWLTGRINALQAGYGIVAYPFDPVPDYVNTDIIGNYTISQALLLSIGGMNTAFDPYGAIDLDYCHRARAAGFRTSYIPGAVAVHQGQHGSGGEYGFNKAEMVQKTWNQHVESVDKYRNGQMSINIPI
jgi:GT2 family glycosyltransferase